MTRWFPALIALILIALAGCRDEPEETDIYPVWILNVLCFEDDITGILQPVRNCPRVTFFQLPGGQDSTVGCVSNQRHRVKVWDHLDSVVTISYSVTCDGYWNTQGEIHTFYEANAIQRPGRPGREHEITDTLILEER